jgi:uncharacterized protein with PIN domain
VEPLGGSARRTARLTSRHGAALNYGDCFAYALAKSRDAPLLCVASDFGMTDIAIA